VNYQGARGQIKSGDLLAWSHRSWASWYDLQVQAVRVFTRSEYCHVGVAWVVAGRVFVIEAVTPQVRIFPLSKLLPFYWMPLGAPWKKETEEFALSQVGLYYSKWQAVKAYFGYTDKDDIWQCAALTRAILSADGVDLNPEKETPSALVYAGLSRDGVSQQLITE
jgi:hypothetical protein